MYFSIIKSATFTLTVILSPYDENALGAVYLLALLKVALRAAEATIFLNISSSNSGDFNFLLSLFDIVVW